MHTSHRNAERRTLALRAGLLLAAFAFLLVRVGRPPLVYDEGLILAGADRILLGEVPFRDFWNTHPPGQIWLVAGLFRLFGESMLVLRVYDAAVKAVLALVLFDWAARLAPRNLAVAAFVVAAIWLEYCGAFGFGYTAFPALLLGLGSINWLVTAGEATTPSRTRRLIAGAGLCTGIAALFRLDFGAYTALAAVATIVAAQARERRRAAPSRLREAAAALAVYGAGVSLPVVVALAVLVAQGVSTSTLVGVLIAYPARVFPAYRGLPLPGFSVWRLAYYVPVWVGVAGLLRGAWLVRRAGGGRSAALAWCGLSLAALVALPQARTRADMVHQAPVLLPTIALAAALWFVLWTRGGALRAGACGLVPVLALAYLAAPVYSWVRPGSPTATTSHGLNRAAGVALEPDQAAAVRAVQQRTRAADAIYVGNTRHDRLVRNDALFYFLASRRYATAYHNLLPGLATRADVQRAMIASLQTTATRCLVLCARFDDSTEPNASSLAGGSQLLDAHIRQAYVFSDRIGGYDIWTAR
jgi:hypothetical protein